MLAYFKFVMIVFAQTRNILPHNTGKDIKYGTTSNDTTFTPVFKYSPNNLREDG
jgi:hypothetical protein